MRRNGRRTPKKSAWRDIVELWEHGVPSDEVYPLMHWPKDWLSGDRKRLFGVKYFQRKVIAEEFIIQYVLHSTCFYLF